MTDHHHKKDSGLTTAFWLNACFSVIEFVGGAYTGSTAIIADAVHDAGDTLAIGLGIFAEKFSRKKSSSGFTYGYIRFPLVSALLLSSILIGSSVVMLFRASSTLLHPVEVNSMGMLWLSVLGIAINGAAFFRIRQSKQKDDHHGHAHSHDPNSKAIMLHLLEDVLGWVAVLIGSILIYFTGWYIIDSILAIAIALFIAFNAGRNLLDTFRILLQASPVHINLDALNRELLDIKGVKAIHNLHIWSLNGRDHVGSLHFIPSTLSEPDIELAKKEIRVIMHRNDISNITIQMDMNEEECKAEEA